MAAPALILFDIDGTLIRRSGPQHRMALEEASLRVLGVRATTDGVPVQGMLDGAILTWMLREAGVAESRVRRAMPHLTRVAEEWYLRNPPPCLRDRVCPGVRALLSKLRRRGAVTGLVTGNFSRIGWKKMEHAALGHYFRYGAFAEQAEDRAGLVRIALRQAAARGWMSAKTPVWLIGDHPNDVMAAKANGIASVGVATGIATAEELGAASPSVLVEDLRALRVGHLISYSM